MTRQLRNYQQAAVDAVRERWAQGDLRTAVILPTGAGKTDVIAAIAVAEVRAGGRVLIMAHRSELLDQCGARCRMHDPSVRVGRIQANRNDTMRPITVAMSQTLAGEKRRARLDAAWERRGLQRPTLVIVDECHHAASPSQLAILEWAGCYREQGGTRAMGVTATMSRGKQRGAGLGDVWQSIAYQRDIAWAIEQGWLVRPHGLAVVTEHLDLNQAKVRSGDYVDSELGEMVSQDVASIADAWLEHGENRITAAFTPDVQSATDLRDAFLARGVKAELVTGATPHAERAGIYDRLAAGVTRVMTNVMVASEGWDCPTVSCILMARPTRSLALYQQICGRALRQHPDKRDALVLDCVGATRALNLRTLADLAPGLEYDQSAVEALPCEMCGGYRSRVPEGEQRCECPLESEPREKPKLIGPQRYVEVDLLATSSAVWLQTEAGRPFIPAMDRIVVLWQEAHGLYTCGWVPQKRDASGRYQPGKPITPFPVSLDEARRRAEAWATNYAPSYARRDAPWRKATSGKAAQPSEGQCALARDFGMRNPEGHTRAAVSDVISIGWASLRLDRVT